MRAGPDPRHGRRSVPPPRAAAVGATLALLLTASSASAQDGHSLRLSGPAAGVTGEPVVLTAAGTVPPGVLLNRYLNVYALPAGVVGSCPATFQGALQIKDNTTAQGGETVALAVPAEGGFSTPVAYTPSRPGRFLLCGYLHEGIDTMASASLTLDVAAPGAGAATAPRNVRAPGLTRAGARLRCSRGRWAGRPGRFTYRWQVAGRRVAGATRPTLAIGPAVRGRGVRCAVTARNAAGSATALSRTIRIPRAR